MRMITKDWIGEIIEVGHLYFVEEDAILKFARVAHHHAVSGNDVFPHVTTTADTTIFTDPGRSLQHCALLDNRSSADEHLMTDKRLTHQLAQDPRLQSKLEISLNLFERVPDVVLALEQFRVGRVFEIKKICRRKHECASKMINRAQSCQRIFLGNTRVPRVGFGVAPTRTLLLLRSVLHGCAGNEFATARTCSPARETRALRRITMRHGA